MRLTVLLVVLLALGAQAAESIDLIDPGKPLSGWSFGNGAEFPGAKGGLVLDEEVVAQHRPALRLDGDFTGGGNYVQIGRAMPDKDVESLSFWLRAPKDLTQVTLRVIDATDQCHQLNLRIEPGGAWQQVTFPLARYFAKAGTSAAVETVVRYEGWGGAKDGKWHGPAKNLFLLTGRTSFGESLKGSFWISGVKVQVAPEKTTVVKELRLDDFLREGEVAWSFIDGREFPGAKGDLTAVKDEPVPGEYALRLRGDFTGGGAYIAAGYNLGGAEVMAIRMKVKTANVESCTVRLVDGTDQCHQIKGFKLIADGQWHDVVIDPAKIAGGEHWGGANDGIWHGQAKNVSIVLGKGKDATPELLITDIRAEVQVIAAVGGEGYAESFDSAKTLPEGWNGRGSVIILSEQAFEGVNALRVARTDDQLTVDTGVTGAAFPAASGPWSLGGSLRSVLHSPDSSFSVVLAIEALNAAGGSVERIALVDQTGEKTWKPFSRQVELPKGTVQARFVVTVNKTHGTCDIDALTATPIVADRQERIVDRIVIASQATGNLFFPEDEVVLSVDIDALKPLPKEARTIQVVITDYWGAELLPPANLSLERTGVAEQRFRYSAKVTLAKEGLELGKYHELHVSLHADGYEDASEYSAFARLPMAESRSHKPEEIPFTIRNWDSRIPEYFRLADRIGIRQMGVWGGWPAGKPDQPHLPGVDLCEELGAKWITGTPASDVERNGFKNYSEAELKAGMTSFLKQFAHRGLRAIAMGNEPSEKEEKIAEKVKAYQAVYEAVKAFDPKITVIATSVPALDDFFAAGYHKYCDIYDFHVYETYANVREGVRRYKHLMEKYHAPKPIWSTEIGLNSQGQTRHAVANELVKKITAFFAEGGVSVSWFTIMYPDKEGKARGTSGDSHNTFDAKYNRYNPRLDAIMYYHMVNGIAVKTFADEVQHPDGVQNFLFRDAQGECFHVLWHEGGRVDRGITLPGVAQARVIRIDGSSIDVAPEKGVLTLALSEEPVLIRYRSESAKLAKELVAPSISVGDQALTILKGRNRTFQVTGTPLLKPEQLQVEVPPNWTASVSLAQDEAGLVSVTITAPELTDARTGRIMLHRLGAGGAVCGELILPLTIMSPISVEVFAAARDQANDPGLRVRLTNNGAEAKPLTWTIELLQAYPMKDGSFTLNDPQVVEAYLKGENEGRASLAPGEVRDLRVTIVGSDPQTIYRIRVNVTDEVGRRATSERLMGGFASAAHAATAPIIDGKLDDAVWAKATRAAIGEERQFQPMKGQHLTDGDGWHGVEDLSAGWRAAWDDQALYLAVEVTDDLHRVQFADGSIWNQDGLQFLFDPTRPLVEKAGKYDYSVGKGTKGPQAWCHLTASAKAPDGAAPEFTIAVADLPGSAGGRLYEIAIPWARLAPFAPGPGQNLGMSMILNEDDGPGREGFMGWFSGVHSKQLDLAGDLVLGE